MSYHLYWGDLHSHGSVSYGGGSVEQALARARGQLDFCSITGHAFWPDMPTDRDRYGAIIDYHREGFARLARNWESLLQRLDAATIPGEFVGFPSYEWHSRKYGDHNVYAKGPSLPLCDAPDLPALQRMVRQCGAIAVPHHIGYAAGYRGIDWRFFNEQASPLVEIFSLHGCSESDAAPYPLLHDMGPRDAGGTAEAGWAMGHRFGVLGSSDHHGGYPGSHGDGRAAVFASSLSREALWEALLARRVYAVTGDKIDARLFVNDAWIGSTIQAQAPRRIQVRVRASDALDRVEVVKNGRVLKRIFPGLFSGAMHPQEKCSAYRLRITWGWGRKDELVRWQTRLSLSDGAIRELEPCFSGQSVVAPQGVAGHQERPDEEDLPHEIVEQTKRSCAWRSITTGNLSTRHSATQAISLAIEAPLDASVTIETGGRKFTHKLQELLLGGRCHYLRGWLSEAIRIGPLVPESDCVVDHEFVDEPDQEVDVYRLRVAQQNGQWAWLTPIWAQR